MIRIVSRRVDQRTMVSVAGNLAENHLAELEEHCAAAETAVIFDLTDLKTADKVAIGWLSTRVAEGDEVLGASPYIRLLLERYQKGPEPLSPAGSNAGRSTDEEGE